ncbi:MAG: hypothetical protein ACRC5T_11105 [Cetobacterium sp.]
MDFKHISKILDGVVIKIVNCSHGDIAPTAQSRENEADYIANINNEN